MLNSVFVIEPGQKISVISAKELFAFRELLYFLVWRDLKIRYRQTLLGVLWVVLQPVFMMALYSIIFGSIVRLPEGKYPYALFVLSGLIPWTFVSSSISDSGNSLLINANLIGKIYSHDSIYLQQELLSCSSTFVLRQFFSR